MKGNERENNSVLKRSLNLPVSTACSPHEQLQRSRAALPVMHAHITPVCSVQRTCWRVCACVSGSRNLCWWCSESWTMLCACEKVAVTLLAPGRRWSFTYGSASPLESMAFSPCGHKQAHKRTQTSCHIRCTRMSGMRGWWIISLQWCVHFRAYGSLYEPEVNPYKLTVPLQSRLFNFAKQVAFCLLKINH